MVGEGEVGGVRATRATKWADLMRRVFEVDALECLRFYLPGE